jgi:hypothetical protein
VTRRDRPILAAELADIETRRLIMAPKLAGAAQQYGYSGFTVVTHQHGGPLVFETQHQM